jgi:RNA polymerase sigma-70 factor (ECF subfamily)
MAADDASLVLLGCKGDRRAFGELVVRHERAMLAVARAYFASEADAEDAVQDAFVQACGALDGLRDPSRFAAWLTRITINASLAILRARRDKQSLADFASTVSLRPRVQSEQLTPATLATKSEEAEQVKAAIGRLPEAQRVVIMLRYAADMTYDELAAYLGVPASTVRGRLHLARTTLKALLDGGR